jgi:PDZ domain-containing secreted protein
MTTFRLLNGLTVAFWLITAAVSMPTTAGAQRMVTRTISGAAYMIPGLGAVVAEDSGQVKVIIVPAAGQRSEAYKNVDLEEGDFIIMCNGKRVSSVAEFQKRMDSVAVGGDVRLGIQRKADRRIATFVKADEAAGGGAQMMVMQTFGDQSPDSGGAAGMTAVDGGAVGIYSDGNSSPAVAVAAEAGLLLGEADSGLYVMQLVPTAANPSGSKPVEGGYLVVAVQDKSVRTVAEFKTLYDAAKPGDKLKLSFKHGAESFSNTYIRTSAQPMIQMKTQ